MSEDKQDDSAGPAPGSKWRLARRVVNAEVRSVLENEGDVRKWVPNNESSNCMRCDQAFNLIHRKHHCRNCGFLVCSVCSSFTHKFEKVNKPLRVCDSCFSDLNSNSEPNESLPNGLANPQSLEVSIRNQVPWWLYLFKPFSEKGRMLPIGQLYVNIMEAKNLPKMDVLGLCDPYVILELGEEKERTATIHQTLSPKWRSSQYYLNVLNPQQVLKLSVYDSDWDMKDDIIGTVEIPLSTISHQIRFKKWFNIKLSPKVPKPKSERLPCIAIELQYSFSKLGEFASFFCQEMQDPTPDPKFQVARTQNAVFLLLDLLQPLFSFLGEINSVLFWEVPFKTMIVFIFLVSCCFWAALFPLALQILLIAHILFKFSEKSIDDSMKLKSLSRKLSLMQKQISETDSESSASPNHDIHELPSDGILMKIAKKSFTSSDLKETLKWIQNLIVMICEYLQLVYNLFNWSNPATTFGILVALLLSSLWTFYYGFSMILLIVIIYVFTLFTTPGLCLQWILSSWSAYMSRPINRSAADEQWDHVFEAVKPK